MSYASIDPPIFSQWKTLKAEESSIIAPRKPIIEDLLSFIFETGYRTCACLVYWLKVEYFFAKS